MTDCDTRQFSLMQGGISEFRSGRMPLGGLVDGLEGLIQALENPRPGLRDKLLAEWGCLEDVFAETRVPDSAASPEELDVIVKAALQNLEALIPSPLPGAERTPDD